MLSKDDRESKLKPGRECKAWDRDISISISIMIHIAVPVCHPAS